MRPVFCADWRAGLRVPCDGPSPDLIVCTSCGAQIPDLVDQAEECIDHVKSCEAWHALCAQQPFEANLNGPTFEDFEIAGGSTQPFDGFPTDDQFSQPEHDTGATGELFFMPDYGMYQQYGQDEPMGEFTDMPEVDWNIHVGGFGANHNPFADSQEFPSSGRAVQVPSTGQEDESEPAPVGNGGTTGAVEESLIDPALFNS